MSDMSGTAGKQSLPEDVHSMEGLGANISGQRLDAPAGALPVFARWRLVFASPVRNQGVGTDPFCAGVF